MDEKVNLTPFVDVLVGIIEDGQGRILVSRRRPGTHMAGYWEFPGGKRESGEPRFDALRRELREELGIEVLSAEPVLIHAHEYPDKVVHLDVWRVHCYEGEPFGFEDQELKWVAAVDLRTVGVLPADGAIVDALLQSR